MSLRDFKNESLFHSQTSQDDAQATVAHALHMGWAHPAPANGHVKPPKAKRKMWLSCEAFRSDKDKLPSGVPSPA